MKTEHFVVTDPREFDGDAYQVAERAVAQAKALTTQLLVLLEPTRLMARNAELERLLADNTDQDELRRLAHAWDESPQGRSFAGITEKLSSVHVQLSRLEKAVAYNPKSREARR